MPKIIENPAEAILNHAREIVINEGYASLTMRKVSNISGIAVGTIYNYFPTKEHLALKLIEDYWYEYAGGRRSKLWQDGRSFNCGI